jgi:hypothetical protein
MFAALLVVSCIACSSLYLHLTHQLLVPLYNSIPLQASWKGWVSVTFVLATAITIPDDITSWGASYVVSLAAIIVADVTALFGRDLGSWYTVSLGAGPGAARIQIWLLATVLGPLTAFGACSLVSCVTTKRGRILSRTTSRAHSTGRRNSNRQENGNYARTCNDAEYYLSHRHVIVNLRQRLVGVYHSRWSSSRFAASRDTCESNPSSLRPSEGVP